MQDIVVVVLLVLPLAVGGSSLLCELCGVEGGFVKLLHGSSFVSDDAEEEREAAAGAAAPLPSPLRFRDYAVDCKMCQAFNTLTLPILSQPTRITGAFCVCVCVRRKIQDVRRLHPRSNDLLPSP